MFACQISAALPQTTALAALFDAFAVDWKSLGLSLLWFGIVILTLILESQTADLVAIWFAPGAFVAMLLSFFGVPFWCQLGVFVGLTAVGLILSFTLIRPLVRRRQHVEKTNADALPGQLALVEEDIDNRAPKGVVKIHGQLWTARMENSDLTAQTGEWVEIIRVEGSKLICRPKS